MTFQDAQLKLLAYVRDRIHNGELTERGLARLIGISQPHTHNVLKGVRNLSPKISDSMLKVFHISILDLVPPSDLEANFKKRKTPSPLVQLGFLASPVGPGMPWPAGIDWTRLFPLPFPASMVPANLQMASLAADPDMHRTLQGSDLAILDSSERQRTEVSPEGLYAVSRRGEAVLRHVRPGARYWYLVTDTNLDSPDKWERISVGRSKPSVFIKARVLWLGRGKDRDLPMHQRGRFLYDAISS